MTTDAVVPLATEGLAAIAADRSRGAAELAAAGVALLGAVAEAAAASGEEPISACRQVARRLCVIRPSMAALGNWAAAFMTELDLRAGRSEPWHEAGRAIARRRAENAERLVEAGRALLAPPLTSVLTLSYSSTIAGALVGLGRRIDVLVGEGRPLFEGRKLAERLHATGHRVTLLTDAALAGAAGEASAILLGADTICQDGTAINKTGSLAAALGARRAGVPVHVLADRMKFEPDRAGGDMALERMEGEEVWPGHGALCRNVYFEPVPADLISAIVTEDGPISPSALGPVIDAVAALRRVLERS